MKLEHLIKDPKEFEIFQKYYAKRGQFQVVEFANEIGIRVFLVDLNSKISAQLTKDERGNFSIKINGTMTFASRYRAITRQLANYFRHKEYFETNSTLEEVEYFD